MESNQEVIELLRQIAHNTAQTELRILALENTMNEIEGAINARLELIDSRLELATTELEVVNTSLSSMNISEGFNLKDLWDELSDIKNNTDNGAYGIEDITNALHELEMTIIKYS